MLYWALAATWLTVLIEIIFKDRSLIVIIPYGIVVPLLFLFPRAYINWLKNKYDFNPNWIKHIYALGFFTILVNAPGTLFLYETGIQWDRVVHVFSGFLDTTAAFLILLPFYKKYKFNKILSLYLLGPLAVSCTFLWEGYQWTADHFFGTHLFHDAVQTIQQDFTEDIFFGCVGIIAALIFIAIKHGYFSSLISQKKKL